MTWLPSWIPASTRLHLAETWYRAAHPRLLAALVIATGDIEAARDATSEAFTRALQHRARVHAMDAPEAWVHRVGINLLRRRHRRRILEERLLRRQRLEPAPPPQVAPEVWDALASLPLRPRQALALRYLLGMTQAEVADAMGVAPGTAAATLHQRGETSPIGGYPDPTAASVEHGPVPAVDRLGRRVEVPHGRHSLAAAPPGDGCSNSPTFVASDRAAATTGTVVNITGGSVID